ncbi:hypothetical protein BJ742DRAFT_797892 [Cladochytrium replicatum]|nr:hypothetical protein BJ742DRAFT_797892 [Cladochytrium replicatum]
MEKGNVFHPECRVTVSSATLACSKCSKPITAKFLKVDDAVWHQECFTCADCNKSLSNEGFSTTSDGSNVCDICLKARNVGQPKTAPGWTYNQRTGLKELRGAGGVKLGEQAGLKALGAKSVCPACEKTVYMAEEVPGPMGSKWHRACLRCKGCRSQLDSHAKLRDNMPYCRNCFVCLNSLKVSSLMFFWN